MMTIGIPMDVAEFAARWQKGRTDRKEKEALAAELRQRIRELAHVIEEMEHSDLEPDALNWRLRAVELGLRRLRQAA